MPKLQKFKNYAQITHFLLFLKVSGVTPDESKYVYKNINLSSPTNQIQAYSISLFFLQDTFSHFNKMHSCIAKIKCTGRKMEGNKIILIYVYLLKDLVVK